LFALFANFISPLLEQDSAFVVIGVKPSLGVFAGPAPATDIVISATDPTAPAQTRRRSLLLLIVLLRSQVVVERFFARSACASDMSVFGPLD
jgi:hypothetical protein